MPLDNIQMHVIITGIVQGVFFRAETKKTALENNVTGWVKNCEDGSVEAVIEGTKEDIDKVVQWCHQGPDAAFVGNVEIKEQSPLSNFDSFEVK
jgi:acylphosphatase